MTEDELRAIELSRADSLESAHQVMNLVREVRRLTAELARARGEGFSEARSAATVKEHKLKTWPEHFENLMAGRKTFELRKADRDFEVGDALLLEEWDPKTERYSGRRLRYGVWHILRGPVFGLEDGYVIMSLGVQPEDR